MSFRDFEKEKDLEKDLQNLFEGKVTYSKSELLDYLKKETPEVEEEQVEEISEEDSEEVSFKELVDDPIEEIPETNEESVIEEPNETQETPVVSRMDRLLDEVETPSEPTVAPKAGTFLVAGGGGENNAGTNVGNGVEIFKGIGTNGGSPLQLRTLSASGSASVTQVGDLIVIGASVSADNDSWPSVSADYYTSTQVNSISSTLSAGLSGQDKWSSVSASYYTSNQTNNLLSNKADLSAVSGDNDSWSLVSANYYTRTQVVDGTPDFQILDFNTTAYSAANPSHQEGRVFWDYTNHTLAMYNDNSDVTLQIGQESWIRVVNRTTSAIANGTVVRINGAHGDRPTIIPVIADSSYGAEATVGITTHNIAVNEEGYITTEGIVNDVNTSGFYLGAPLFLSDTVSGGFRITPPSSPATVVFVGICTRVHHNTGKIFATIRVNPRLTSLSDVDGTTPKNGYILGYNGNSFYWDPTNILNTSGGFSFGTSANNTSFAQDTGYLSAAGSACAWDDLRVAGSSVGIGASAPDLVTMVSGGLLVRGFDGNATLEQVYFEIQMPHAWKIGSTISPHVHWTPTTTASGGVVWFLEYTWANINGTFSNPTTISGLQSATNEQWKHKLCAFPDIVPPASISGVSSMIVCRLYRSPTVTEDTYPNDAGLLEFDIHYQIDSFGSRYEYSK